MEKSERKIPRQTGAAVVPTAMLTAELCPSTPALPGPSQGDPGFLLSSEPARRCAGWIRRQRRSQTSPPTLPPHPRLVGNSSHVLKHSSKTGGRQKAGSAVGLPHSHQRAAQPLSSEGLGQGGSLPGSESSGQSPPLKQPDAGSWSRAPGLHLERFLV